MRRFAYAIAALAIAATAASSIQPATAGGHHQKRNIAPTVSERLRNAEAYFAPAPSPARDPLDYDEALSPPAGH
jgi:hypothetical protein